MADNKPTMKEKLHLLIERFMGEGATSSDASQEYSLKSGSKVKIDKLEAGGAVTDADGKAVKAGDYELVDGTKIKVGENGIISQVGEEQAQAMSEQTLSDGNKVYIDKIEVGGKVTAKDAAGVESPAASGTYTLTDGTVLTIGGGGVIAEVVAPVQMSEQDRLKSLTEGFATGTPEERIARLETMCLALMGYCFGWEIRDRKEHPEMANEAAIKEAALKVFGELEAGKAAETQQAMSAIEQKFQTQIEATNTKTKEAFAGFTEILSELAETSGEGPIDQQRYNFLKADTTDKQERLIERMRQINEKKAQAAN